MSDHTFALLKDAIVALPTALFTGFVAFWTWRRDQECVRVTGTRLGGEPPSDSTLNGEFSIRVLNLSLLPIQIVRVGFVMGNGVEVTLPAPEGDALPPSQMHLDELGVTRTRVKLPAEIASRTSKLFVATNDDLGVLIQSDHALDVASVRAFAILGSGKKILSVPLLPVARQG